MTNDGLKAIQERAEKVTKGQWHVSDTMSVVLDTEGVCIAVCPELAPFVANADFIAHAKEDIPMLLKALAEARAECEDVGKPIGYDPTYALAQSVLAILGGKRG